MIYKHKKGKRDLFRLYKVFNMTTSSPTFEMKKFFLYILEYKTT